MSIEIRFHSQGSHTDVGETLHVYAINFQCDFRLEEDIRYAVACFISRKMDEKVRTK